MALKAILASLDGLPDAIKAEYKQDGDKFVLDVTPTDGFALEDITGLKNTLAKKNTEVNGLKASLKSFEVDGVLIDAAAAVNAMATVKNLGNLTPEQLADQKVKAALDQANAQFTAQLTAKDTENKGLLTNLEAVMIDQAATAALAAKGGNVKLLLPHVKANVKMVKTDKGYNVHVVDAEGNARVHVAGGKASDMTLEHFVEEMSASNDFAAAFTAQANPGAGTATQQRRTGSQQPNVIRASDSATVNGSLKDIASGKTVVELGS